MSHPLRPELPTLPPRLAHLPIDGRGYPVPWFVAWIDGKPDHRIVDSPKIAIALRASLCWMCGKHLGAFKTLPIGPMCTITRTIAEPPCHLECARYAAQACPWITRPHAKRREAALPEHHDAAGMIKRNPGAICLWTTKHFRPFKADNAKAGERDVLFDFEGEPEAIEWWAEGRPATRSEVEESILSGLPILKADLRTLDDLFELQRRVDRERARLAAYAWPAEVDESAKSHELQVDESANLQ